MSELRQIVPSESERAGARCRPSATCRSCYDVFDIDGDGTAEVMGVQYYLAYKSNEHTPVAGLRDQPARALLSLALRRQRRRSARSGRRRIKEVPVCRFVGKKADGGADAREPAALRGDVRAGDRSSSTASSASPFDSDAGLRAQPRAAQGRRRPHDRSGEALAEVIEARKESSPQVAQGTPISR